MSPSLQHQTACIHYDMLSAMLNPLHGSMDQKLFEKHLCNQRIAIIKNSGNFHYDIMYYYHQVYTFHKDEYYLHKRGYCYKECIVCTAVSKKTPLGLK